MPRYPFVVCVADSRPIWLPCPKPSETTPNQPEWPTEILSRKLCCPECGHTFLYTERHVQWELIPLHDQGSDFRAGIACWRIEIGCEEDRCGLPIVFHMTVDGSKDTPAISSLVTKDSRKRFFKD